MLERALAGFQQRFGREPDFVIRAPGRVNLIGDHTDYNDGFVLPMALDRALWMSVGRADHRRLEVASEETGDDSIDLNHIEPQGTFADYITGVINAASEPFLSGLDIWIGSDVPVGAGLSSSAALAVATTLALAEVTNNRWDPIEAAQVARRAENDWVGVATGIMDQLVIATASAGSASLIDCRSLTIGEVELPRKASVVVLDSGTRRQLAHSAYNERRQACFRAAAALGVEKLRDASLAMLLSGNLDPVDARRARHVITENDRVLAFASALRSGDLERAGKLMTESHLSLRNDFEVSTSQLDALVQAAEDSPGCYGARLTGAGMGGCAVAIVSRSAGPSFRSSVVEKYRAATGLIAGVFVTEPSTGVRVDWRRSR